jgi:hypothetical protein
VTRETLVTAVCLLAAAGGVGLLQPRLARAAHAAGERENDFSLPPPAQLRAATLGWDAAAVDVIWADLLVEYGTHWADHREFEDTGRYADAILELEPGYPPLYRYIDTMLVYRPLQGTEKDARAARAYLERGTREHPTDASIWLEYGQFEAFIGPSFLTDDKQVEAWRQDGAVAMAHAVELGASPDRALTAASLLTRAGQAEMAIASLERAYAFTEHPSMAEVHEAIREKILYLRQVQQHSGASAPPRDNQGTLEAVH